MALSYRSKRAPKAKVRKSFKAERMLHEKFTGPEPTWQNSDTWTKEQLDRNWSRGYNYYNYHYQPADLRDAVGELGLSRFNWSQEDLAAFNRVEDRRVGITLCSAAKMLLNGAPMREETANFIEKKFKDILERGRSHLQPKSFGVVAERVSVQDRMREKLHDVLADIEGFFDDYCYDNKLMPDILGYFKETNMPQQYVNQIAERFTPRMQELSLARSKAADDQLREGYKHLNKAQFDRLADFYQTLTLSLETYGAVKKAVRKARVKKLPSQEKLVRKIKYCAQFNELNLVSVNPIELIGSTQIWVYNTKTRKLGKYVADASSTVMTVKGSGIVGFDPKLSVAKTLRKPQQQLKDFAAAGKVLLRTFLEDIKAVGVELNGRINKDVVLLKVVK